MFSFALSLHGVHRMSVMVMNIIEQLESIRSAGGTRITQGLPDETVERFAASHPAMVEAVEAAVKEYDRLKTEFPELMAMDEMDQVGAIQSGLVNFYAQDAVNPYVSLAARGPWIVTTKGAVLHDNGGYGMLGFGHVPGTRHRGHEQAPGHGQRHDPELQPASPGGCPEEGNRAKPGGGVSLQPLPGRELRL